MSSLMVYVLIVAFWLVMGGVFLLMDLIYGWPRVFIAPLGREVSAAWPCFFLAAYSSVRLVLHWSYQQQRIRKRMIQEAEYARQQATKPRRADEPPNPDFQFDPPTGTPPS